MKLNSKMIFQPVTCVSIVLIYCLLSVDAISCDSCGQECASACGTRHFRTCCFNYLRKRSSTPPLPAPHAGSGEIVPVATGNRNPENTEATANSNNDLNQELWLIKSHLLEHRVPWSELDYLGAVRKMGSENEIDYGESQKDEFNKKRNYIVASHSNHIGRFRLPSRSSSDETDDYDGRYVPVGVDNGAASRSDITHG